jgi:ribosomal protein S18 acetylase RimI-like enzyme
MTSTLEVVIDRSRDPNLIEQFLTKDYFDFPICLFSKRLCSAAARWMSKSESVFFITATESGHRAGFVFANTLGKRLWRCFAREHLWLLPDLLWAFGKSRLPRKWTFPGARFAHAVPQGASEKVARLDLPTTEAAFAWSKPDSRTGYVELLFVSAEFRGHNVGSRMLDALRREMSQQGIRRIEAHIDHANYASIRAFSKANWIVAKTPQHDFLTYTTCGQDA